MDIKHRAEREFKLGQQEQGFSRDGKDDRVSQAFLNGHHKQNGGSTPDGESTPAGTSTSPGTTAFRLRGVYKSYLRGKQWIPVLQGVDLRAAQGEFLAILGPSGCGKSTVLNLLAGLECADAGSVFMAATAEATCAAYMQQRDLLLPWRTVWENVLLAPELRSAAARRASETQARYWLQAFGLEKAADAYPAQLSGGMRQRVALIRTLLCGESVLLLDEPFSALDAMTRRRLHALLESSWRAERRTVVLVTHDVDEALRLAERIVLMTPAPGRIQQSWLVQTPWAEREHSLDLFQMRGEILEALHDA